jgi:membrane-bound lytic murein transglycosylase D
MVLPAFYRRIHHSRSDLFIMKLFASACLLVLFLVCAADKSFLNAQQFAVEMDARFIQSEQQWLIATLLENTPKLYQQPIEMPLAYDTVAHFQFGPHAWSLSKAHRDALKKIWQPKDDTERIARICSLMDLYHPLFQKEIQKAGLPAEYLYIPLLASGLNQHHQSAQNRCGLWGLDYLTARKIGLEIQDDFDERRGGDFTTKAAVRHLKSLFDTHQDPILTALLFLHGAPAVMPYAPIRYDALPLDWQLEISFLLHASTFIPAMRLDNYQSYYFDEMQFFSPIRVTDTVPIAAIEAVLKEKRSALLGMNPIITGDHLVPGSKKVPYYLWTENAQKWSVMEDSLLRWKSSIPLAKAEPQTSTHTVRKGESLGSIAQKHHVSVKSIQQTNRMKHTQIRPGQVLKIPKASTHKTNEKPEIKTAEQKQSSPKEEVYIVKNGDSLWKIAKRFKGVTESEIKEWNHCSDDIRPGQKLIIRLD